MTPCALIETWVSLFNAADAAGLANLYTQDATNHQVALAPVEGRDAIRAMFEKEFAAAEMVCIPEAIHEVGDVVVLEWRDPLGLRGCGVFTVTNGLIAFQRGYWDRLSFLRLHGLPKVLEPDVPSPVDWSNIEDVLAWERTAQARPGRAEMFHAFAAQLKRVDKPHPRVLELGSGPAFLAGFLLRELPNLRLTLLDISPAMHERARERLGPDATRVSFLERDFKESAWTDGLESFDVVVTNQAVHELRHKQHATRLHAQVAGLLNPGGCYLVCDHFQGDGGMANASLYMSIPEQRQALIAAGFGSVEQIHKTGALVLHRAVV